MAIRTPIAFIIATLILQAEAAADEPADDRKTSTRSGPDPSLERTKRPTATDKDRLGTESDLAGTDYDAFLDAMKKSHHTTDKEIRDSVKAQLEKCFTKPDECQNMAIDPCKLDPSLPGCDPCKSASPPPSCSEKP